MEDIKLCIYPTLTAMYISYIRKKELQFYDFFLSLFFLVEQLDVLELLVQNGADLDARTKNNETPYGKWRKRKIRRCNLKYGQANGEWEYNNHTSLYNISTNFKWVV